MTTVSLFGSRVLGCYLLSLIYVGVMAKGNRIANIYLKLFNMKKRISIQEMNGIVKQAINDTPINPAFDLTVFDGDNAGNEVVRIAKSLSSSHLGYILKYANKSISRNEGVAGKPQIRWIVEDVHWEKIKDENNYSTF